MYLGYHGLRFIHDNYGLMIPAADIFYPALTDDILEHFDALRYVGLADVNGQSCVHVMASSKAQRIQFWISTEAINLPLRYSIDDYKNGQWLTYTATFTDWHINPDLPDAMFSFETPSEAMEIRNMAGSSYIRLMLRSLNNVRWQRRINIIKC